MITTDETAEARAERVAKLTPWRYRLQCPHDARTWEVIGRTYHCFAGAVCPACSAGDWSLLRADRIERAEETQRETAA
jgi:hypothetical protein